MSLVPAQHTNVRAYSFSVTDLTFSTALGALYSAAETYTVPENLTGKKVVITFETTNSNAALCTIAVASGTSLTVRYFRWDAGSKTTGKLYVLVAD